MPYVKVRRLGLIGRFADFLMTPIMYFFSGTISEKPQRTHRWNNRRLSDEEVKSLKLAMMERCEGMKGAGKRRLVLFHLPILGGWRSYVVLQPLDIEEKWYVGWITPDVKGVSRIPLRGPVRMLRGPSEVAFFGVSGSSNQQIWISRVGVGCTGSGGSHAKIPLL